MSTNTANNSLPQSISGQDPRQYRYLLPKRKSAYKQLFVMGRIFPWSIYGQYVSEEDPMTVEEIAYDWDLPVEAVREAIAYYESNPPEMVEDFRREELLMEATGMNDPNYRYNPQPKFLTPQERAAIERAAAQQP